MDNVFQHKFCHWSTGSELHIFLKSRVQKQKASTVKAKLKSAFPRSWLGSFLTANKSNCYELGKAATNKQAPNKTTLPQ